MSLTPLGTVSLLAILVAMGCSASSASTTNTFHSGAGGTGSGANGTGSTSNGGEGTFVVGTGGTAPIDADSGMTCDSTGKCTCINIAEFGKTGDFGAVQGQDGSTAFQQWLNSKSTAVVDVYATRTTITPDLLSKYQVIILQALTNVVSWSQQSDYWTYGTDEVKAVADWVNNGGAIISLTGYYSSGTPYEIAPTNQLLSFSGISYNGDDIMSDCPNGLCYCWGGSSPITAWNAAEQMTTGITAVGAFHGRSIKAPGDATIFATYGGQNVAVGMKVGKGRVYAFGDEWITYNSQWNDSILSVPLAKYSDPTDPCNGHLPSKEFQIPQFWFNTISWCQPVVAKCFKIDEPTIVPVIIN